MTSPRIYAFLLALAGSLLLCSPARAQHIPIPNLQAVFPMGGRVGSDCELLATGKDIEGQQRLIFSHPGITAAPVILKADRFYPSDRPAPNRFVIHIGRDVAPGSYEVRLANPQGVSNARAFLVDRLPEVQQPRSEQDTRGASTAANNDAASAQQASVDSIINGVCTPQLSDYYKITAKKGQRLILHCSAQYADSRADIVLGVDDAAGNHLQEMHDSVRIDPTLDFTVPHDGEYVACVHDFLYRGGSEYGYRLAISTGPWIDYIDPPFALTSAAGQHTLYGRNLPGSTPAGVNGADGRPLETLTVTIKPPGEDAAPALDTLLRPTDGSIATFSYRLETPGGMSNSMRLALASGSLLQAQQSHDTPEKAQALTIPAQVIGSFHCRNDREWFTFHAAKGEKLWIDVVSQRLGLPTDPCLLVQRESADGNGKTSYVDVAEADDQTVAGAGNNDQRFRLSGDDPSLAFTAPQDGTYRLLLRDLYGSAQGEPRFFYLLNIRPAQPDFRLLGYCGRPDVNNGGSGPYTAVLRRGGTVELDVLAFRADGFDGQIALHVKDLPPGVTTSPAFIGPGAQVGTIVLRAGPDASDWSGAVHITGTAIIHGTEISRPARPAEVYGTPSNGANSTPARLVGELALAVRGDVVCPYSVDVVEAKTWRVPRGGKLQIPLKMTPATGRRGAAAQLTAQGLPQLVRMPGGRQLTMDRTSATIDLDIDPTTPPGTFSFVLHGDATISYTRNPDDAKRATDDRTRIEGIVQQCATETQKAADAHQRCEQDVQQFQALAAKLEQSQATLRQTADSTLRAQARAEQKLADAKLAAEKAQEALTALPQTADSATRKQTQKTATKAQTALEQATASATEAKRAATVAAALLPKAVQDKADAQKGAAQAEKDRQQCIARESKAREDARLADEARRMAGERERLIVDAARPRDLRIVVSSSPIVVEVVETPFALSMDASKIEIKAGGAAKDLHATLKRDFNFDDEVRFDIQPLNGGGGLHFVEKHNSIAKGQNSADLSLQADTYTAPGTFPCKLRARYQLSNREIVLEQPIEVTVTKADKK